jgi:hypothetical protein
MDIIQKLKATDHALTVKELSELLHVKNYTITRSASLGNIPCFRIGGGGKGGDIRFNPKDVATFIQANNHTPKGGK